MGFWGGGAVAAVAAAAGDDDGGDGKAGYGGHFRLFLPFFHLHMPNSQQGPWWGQSSSQGTFMKSDIQISLNVAPKAWRAVGGYRQIILN